ncbi:MAG: hypothetical protein U5R46_12045 [Gammaproteobacteria bacterium]|nr:hypothetical protein [Gammaproteobacteria bacterium]
MLEVSTPTVRADPRLAAEFRPRKVEPWLERLPRTDRDAGLGQLYKALSTQNRVVLDPAVRLQLMELYQAPFRELLALHHSDLRPLSRAPLHPHYRLRQEEMLSMLDAMANGYKVAAMDLAAGRRGHGRDAGLALALQRAMYCLGEVLVTAYELYVRPPGGTWGDVHELYRCAEDEDLCNLEVAALPGGTEPALILGTYVPILLLGASSPHGLLPGEVRRLYELAPQWHRAARISVPDAPPEEPGHFRFNLDIDAPPFPASKSTRPLDGASRILKTLGVARAMHQVLTDLNDSAAPDVVPGLPGVDALPADIELLRRAGRVFGEVDINRGSNRFPAHQEIELHCGFDAVYFACNGDRPFESAIPAKSGKEELAAASDRPAEQFIDLSEPMLGVPIDGDPDPIQTDLAVADRYLPLPARAVNESAGGLCLVVLRDRDPRLKVGDIAACRAAGADDWQVGVVRWLRVMAREVRFGLQFLGPQAVAVAARSRGDTLAAIWLPENPALKLASAIVLPRAAEAYPPELEMIRRDDGAPERLRLLRRKERTGDYEHYLVSLDSSDSPIALSS